MAILCYYLDRGTSSRHAWSKLYGGNVGVVGPNVGFIATPLM